MNLLLIINPIAGKQEAAREEPDISNIFLEAGYDLTLVYTKEEQSIEGQLAELQREQGDFDLIVCAGGDGTLNQTIEAMLQLNIKSTLGYLPAGTTNDFASSLKLPKDMINAAHHVLENDAKFIDVGEVSADRHFVYVASFGAFTKSSYTATQSLKNHIGYLAYVVEGMKELPKIKAYNLRVETENGSQEGEFIFGAVTNTTVIGGIIKLDQELVKLDDGEFELILVKSPKNLMDLSKILVSIMSGKYDPELITVEKAKHLKFESEDEIPWSLDGEYYRGGREMQIENLPRAINLIY